MAAIRRIGISIDGSEEFPQAALAEVKAGLSPGNHTLTANAYGANGAVLLTKTVNFTVPATATIDPEYQKVLDLAAANSIATPDTTQQSTDSQILADWQAAGLWAKTGMFLKWGGTADPAFKLIDMKRLVVLDSYGSPIWSADGVEGNAANASIDLKYNPAVDGGTIWTDSNVEIHAYRNKNGLEHLGALIGMFIGGSDYTMIAPDTGATNYYRINANYQEADAGGSRIGLNSYQLSNGTSLNIYDANPRTVTIPYAVRTNGNLHALARNRGTTRDLFSKESLRYLVITQPLTAAERTAAANILM